MSIRYVTHAALVCDTCGYVEETTHATAQEAREWYGQGLDEWTTGGETDTCPRCSRYTREDACGARPQGHVWGTGWGHPKGQEQPHSDWHPADSEEPRWRIRSCRDCHYGQKQYEGGEWHDYRAEEAAQGVVA